MDTHECILAPRERGDACPGGVGADGQERRFAGMSGVDCNARITETMFASVCPMEPGAEAMFLRAQKSLLVSARGRAHIVRVARTIADLDGSERVAERHLAKALRYRGRAWR